jgi:hypothetical protein
VTEAKAVRKGCISLLARLYIWMNVDACRDTVLGIAMDPMHHPDEVNEIVGVIRVPLRHGGSGSLSLEEDAVRARTWDLVSRVVSSAEENLNNLQTTYANVSFDNWPDEYKEVLKSLVRLIDYVGSEIYFASGAYERKNAAGEDEALTPPERERFYREASPILDVLTDIGLAGLAHHLLQTLESFIPFDPPGVFLRIGSIVRVGQRGGYQYESLAADLLVKLVERYLAEYRPVFREDEACRRTLLEVLDIFVQAGWPSARRLTYNLEEIFR